MGTVPSESVDLPGGVRMPLLGFGTWQITGSRASEATEAALRAGYRHVDTATVYGNEAQVGAGLAAAGVAREEVFVTSKIPPHQADEARATLATSLRALGVDALDLWLIHWPPEGSEGGVGLWRSLLEARESGLVRAVGVSNFSLDQLDALEAATGVLPAVNQIEWSPKLFDAAVLTGHRDRGVVLEGYSALRGGTLTDPTVVRIADELGRTPAQVIIRWHLQHGVVVIPKSEQPERIASNSQVGDLILSEQQMADLDALGVG